MDPSAGMLSLARDLLDILCAFVFLVGLIGNSLVIYVIVRFPKMNTVTNFYILNLALADLSNILALPLYLTVGIGKYWPFGKTLCRVYMGSFYVTCASSSFFLSVIAADRYLLVCWPIQAVKWRTLKRAFVIALVLWLAAIFPFLHILVYSKVTLDGELTHCSMDFSESQQSLGIDYKLTIVYLFAAGFAVPFGLIFFFYSLIIRHLKMINRSVNATGQVEANQEQRSVDIELEKSRKQVTRLVLIVIIIFFICWAPFWILELYFLSDINMSETTNFFYDLAYLIAFANSAVNPIVYSFLSESFRKSFKQACTCIPKCKNNAHGRENVDESLDQNYMDEHTIVEMSIMSK